MLHRRLALIPAALAAVVMLGGAANAQGCSTAALHGLFSASFHGETLGVLSGTPPTLIPFEPPNMVDGIETISFDGAGNIEILSLSMRNGAPAAAGQSGLTDNGFQPQTGTYTVSSDCTGTGTISQPNMEFTFGLVLSNGGRLIRLVNTGLFSAQIPGNSNCPASTGCNVAVQISTEGEKIFNKGD